MRTELAKDDTAVRELPATIRPDWTLGDMFSVFRRRWIFIACSLIFTLSLITTYCLIATPHYQATAQIEVPKESPSAFGLENSVTGDAESRNADTLDYTMTLETEANILQSSTLALEVIKDLRLETTEDYYPERKPGIAIPAWVFFWRKPVEAMSVPLDEAPNRRYAVLKIFARHLKVAPIAGTRLIEISYSDPDPLRAPVVVNRLIQALSDYMLQQRIDATSQASAWLRTQLTGLRKQTAQLEEKAVRLQQETGRYGDDESHNIVLIRLQRLNEALATAESNRILKEAIFRIAQSGDPELISGLAGNSAAGTTPAMNNSLALLQSLRSEEASANADIAQNDSRYGPSHPRMAELHAHLDGIEKSIQDEVHRIGERSRTDFEIAARAENAAKESLDQQEELVNDSNDKAVAYGLAKQEADSSRNVYEGLLAKLKQAGVLEGLRSSGFAIVDPGRVPPTNHPKSPNLPLYYAAAVAGGLILGCSGALVRDFRDHSIRSIEDLELLLGAPLLGVVPRLEYRRWPLKPHQHALQLQLSDPAENSRGIAKENRPFVEGPFIDGLRSLRTSLLLQYEGRPSKVVLVTSSVLGEGKSKLAVYLAGVLAQLGARVLLVDTDLRCPAVHSELGIESSPDLGNALINIDTPPAIQVLPQLPSLSVLCGSEIYPHSAELLASPRMHALLEVWRSEYDFVLLDSPPVLPVTDAIVLAQMSDVVLLVARHRFTPKHAIQRSHQLIRQQLPSSAILGAVLNGVAPGSPEFYEYYGYKGRTYGSCKPRRRGNAGI